MKDLQENKATSKLIQPLAQQSIQENGKNLTMRMGERLHLEIQNTGERLWGELAGCKQGAFLLVWLPALARYRQSLVVGCTVTVRGVNCDFQLCGFRTSISKVLYSPHPLIFLHFPEMFEKLHLRRHDRVECFLPAFVLMEGQEYAAIIVNLSKGGARIVLDPLQQPLHLDQFENQEAFLMFKTVENGREICAKTHVRSVCSHEGRLTLGTEFLDLIGNSETIIDEYVANIREYSAIK
ncbi:MAG TPA: PilZ domain-containing protein [Desulfonatronum sp.]|nr:PilZ domain-containing protein [Desulfonatronum sp.]